ncbi:MAG: hypothetical protein WCW33_06305 [Candidatus Babeliales bacterium]|jgi:hypothetical protein
MVKRMTMALALTAGMAFTTGQSCFATASVKINEHLTYAASAFTQGTLAVPVATLYAGADNIPGAAVDADKPYSLCSATLNTSGAQPAVALKALALADGVTVNGATPTVASPLWGKQIFNIALVNSFPAVTVSVGGVNDKNVYLVTRSDGSFIIKNADDVTINDANTQATNEVVALAASDSPATIFAAVSATTVSWDDASGTNRGIALLRPASDGKSLDVYETTNLKNTGATNIACKLDAITIGGINYAIGRGVNMIWSSELGRLYCGLTEVTGKDAVPGGVLNVVMGRYEPQSSPTSFVLKPIVYSVVAGLFNANAADQIIGYYASVSAQALTATAKNLCIMHTSTNKYYLILCSDIGGTQGVFAVPLLTGLDDVDQNGTVSAVNSVTGVATFLTPPLDVTEMPKATQPAIKVFSGPVIGGDDAYAATTTDNATSLFVVGDTVYLCAKHNDHNVSSGVFAATALFNENGAIRAWHYSDADQAQPVMGQVGQVVGGGRDARVTGDFYALTTENSVVTGGVFGDVNTIRISHWESTTNMGIGNLSEVLSTIFPATEGGVLGLYSFGRKTLGFTTTDGQYFSMLVAMGVNKIAMIQLVTTVAGELVVATNFHTSEPDPNVFVFDATNSPALAAIAPLTYVEWSRMEQERGFRADGTHGWLFVGGRKGVAVLSADDGEGTANVVALSSSEYPGNGDWTFKQLNPDVGVDFTNVRKLVARNERMYVVTREHVYYFNMNTAAKFKTNPIFVGATAIPILNDPLIGDLVVFAPSADPADPDTNIGVIATSRGLYGSDLLANTVLINDLLINNAPAKLAVQLQLLSDRSCGRQTNGNLYALVTNMTNDDEQKPNDKLYRFDVPDLTDLNVLAKPVVVTADDGGKMYDFGTYEQNIDADGSFFYSTLPWYYGTLGNVTLYLQNSAMNSSFNVLPLLNETGRVTGVMHDEATGIIMVPGQSGMDVNG